MRKYSDGSDYGARRQPGQTAAGKKKKKSLQQTGRVSLFGKDESSGIRGNITACTSNLRANERFGIDKGPDASDI